jgi:mono/diheme cytochrome c family protein
MAPAKPALDQSVYVRERRVVARARPRRRAVGRVLSFPPMRHPAVVLIAFVLAIGAIALLVARAVEETKPPPGAALGERVYYRYCIDCHGRDGRGSWRATLFLIRPGDLTDAARMRQNSDAYLRELVKHGGSPLGKPGMPGFGMHLDDGQVDAVIAHMRTLSR